MAKTTNLEEASRINSNLKDRRSKGHDIRSLVPNIVPRLRGAEKLAAAGSRTPALKWGGDDADSSVERHTVHMRRSAGLDRDARWASVIGGEVIGPVGRAPARGITISKWRSLSKPSGASLSRH